MIPTLYTREITSEAREHVTGRVTHRPCHVYAKASVTGFDITSQQRCHQC